MHAAIGEPGVLAGLLGVADVRFADRQRERAPRGFSKPDPATARELLKAAGYNGEKIVVMDATGLPYVHEMNEVLLAGVARDRRQPRRGNHGVVDDAGPPRQQRAAGQGRLEHVHRLGARP